VTTVPAVIEELDEDAQRLLGQARGTAGARDVSRNAVDRPAVEFHTRIIKK
jgi:hypothetical protein